MIKNFSCSCRFFPKYLLLWIFFSLCYFSFSSTSVGLLGTSTTRNTYSTKLFNTVVSKSSIGKLYFRGYLSDQNLGWVSHFLSSCCFFLHVAPLRSPELRSRVPLVLITSTRRPRLPAAAVLVRGRPVCLVGSPFVVPALYRPRVSSNELGVRVYQARLLAHLLRFFSLLLAFSLFLGRQGRLRCRTILFTSFSSR